jgi:predicted GNAT family acetyltransferase
MPARARRAAAAGLVGRRARAAGGVHRDPGIPARRAVTAAVTRQAIETGAPEVLLFTDATNPVTNSIYQRLGYRPAEDRLVLTFT